MNAPAALIKTDLSLLRIAGEADATWTPQPAASLDARALRQRVDEAARWVTQHPAARRRLAAVVVDVDETMCTWLRAPSLAQPVVAAALRTQAQEWGPLAPTASFEALVDADRPRRAITLKRKAQDRDDADTTAPLALLCMPDALLRLLLDALDVRGVRVGPVFSLWHAIAHAWGERLGADTLAATVLVDPAGRLVWAWSRGSSLVAGGLATLRASIEPAETGPPAEPAATPLKLALSRLGLDWLTWSAHLGATPQRVLVVGPDAREVADAIRQRWPRIELLTDDTPDPIAAALVASVPAATQPLAPRRALTRLSQRPTRAARSSYRWGAAALLALALTLAIAGQRMGNAASRMLETQNEIRRQTREDARKEIPTLADTGGVDDVIKSLESNLLSMKVEPFRPPPRPRPIYEEMARVFDVLRRFDGARLIGISLDQNIGGGPRLQARLPDRRTATEAESALRGDGALVRWNRQAAGSDLTDLNLSGQWIEQ